LRKLRVAPEEAVVDGVELGRRLRARHAATALAAGADVAWARLPSEGKGGRGEEEEEEEAAGDEDEEGGGGGGGGGGRARGARSRGGAGAAAAAAAGALLSSTAPLTQGSRALPGGALSLTRLRDANVAEPARGRLRALAWHPLPGAGVLCCGSSDARLRFFRVDGRANALLASVALPELPVSSAGWTGDGSEVIATGRRPFFYAYDVGGGVAARVGGLLGRTEASLESAIVSPSPPASATALIAFLGNDGTTVLAGARSKQWVANLRAPSGTVRAAAFSRGPTGGGGGAGPLDYPELLAVGSAGVVTRWCLRTLKCVGRWADEGSTGGTALAAHPSGALVAVGSASGVVNVYDLTREGFAGGGGGGGGGGSGSGLASLFSAAPAPAKPAATYMSLTTAVDHLAYGGPGGEVLLMSSQRTADALRVAHTGTGKVFPNWPTARTPLAVLCGGAAVSPGGAYLALGNDKGRALLYRLHHFGSS
jgi:U3 small nucleolar RNA-associated protein 18